MMIPAGVVIPVQAKASTAAVNIHGISTLIGPILSAMKLGNCAA